MALTPRGATRPRPPTESQRAQDLLHEKYPGAGGASARVVFAAPAGEKLTDPEHRAAVMESVARAGRASDVSLAIDPYRAKAISKDGRIGYADVIYPMPADKVDDAARDELSEARSPPRPRASRWSSAAAWSPTRARPARRARAS